ncbi:hypothetical protein Celal_3932 [Cellulophaga algicola DSM 14237]|uniref:DUF4149 domain-containing protein n=1 Tax=Cellulophaga algicola (strain DSM 14237 / IC166 / ACAM 630) TaxID=688270 RepID=E6XCC3_CELAD|nr:hypothetical protein [Cellulophaga algicola]ADV51176.1 hypothetical protein Celal_3932 [Cellulophaga algicola DSM 14237]
MKKQKYSIAITFIWVGFIGAISFMEAWLKFRAPGIDTALGLGIGQLVFSALNRVEITSAVLILILSIASKEKKALRLQGLFYTAVVILVLQSVWLLPALDTRADLIRAGVSLAKSKLHLWYVLVEIIKITCLILFGFRSFKHLNTNK